MNLDCTELHHIVFFLLWLDPGKVTTMITTVKIQKNDINDRS